MTESKDDRKAEPPSREAKLAQALRANLRRRKASGAAASASKPHENPSD